jgi:hypothetical protein
LQQIHTSIMFIVVVATFYKSFQNSFDLCGWCIFQIKEHIIKKKSEKETHFTSLQYEYVSVWVSQIKTQTQFEKRERRDWGYRTLIGIFVPTHFHQLCKFLWTFFWNLWCQSFISVVCMCVCVFSTYQQSNIINKQRVCHTNQSTQFSLFLCVCVEISKKEMYVWIKLISFTTQTQNTQRRETWFQLQHRQYLCLCEVHIVQRFHTLTHHINQHTHKQTNKYVCVWVLSSIQFNSIRFNSIQFNDNEYK